MFIGRKTQAKIAIFNKCHNLFINGKCDQLFKIANFYQKTDLVNILKIIGGSLKIKD
jgi:hypothetical protein